jgi:hypothetical protein
MSCARVYIVIAVHKRGMGTPSDVGCCVPYELVHCWLGVVVVVCAGGGNDGDGGGGGV